MIDQVRTPLFINTDRILPAAEFSYTTLRMRGKSTPQFHLKFISICQVQFIRDIADITWYVCQSVLVKRTGWLLNCHRQTSFKDTMLAFEQCCFVPVKFDRSSVSSVWDIKSKLFISTGDREQSKYCNISWRTWATIVQSTVPPYLKKENSFSLLYVLDKSYIKAGAHITQSFLSLLSMVVVVVVVGRGVLQSSVWFHKKNMVFKMMVQGNYWVALILHLLGFLWKWLFGVTNILSRVSSAEFISADDSAWSGTRWWPNQDSLCQIQKKRFHRKFSFYFLRNWGFQVSRLSSEKLLHPKAKFQKKCASRSLKPAFCPLCSVLKSDKPSELWMYYSNSSCNYRLFSL